MRTVIQRVKYAQVQINGLTVGKIEKGVLILLGINHNDTMKEVKWLANKIKDLRIFEDENDKMNLSLKDVNGEVLIISQFTLYGNCIKGRRPSFIDAAKPELANELYLKFIDEFRNFDIKTETGKFGADMKVELLNDGPVTLIIDTADASIK
ncbi:MAG: D-aminoacyl-tRNA deacylase [Fusobacterium gastrosuis]|uniref:D-aminoacyl-tRNA deacylase n=1 Tax=Fusobacterium gastrosuis TaxID=1755100 RepID=UPI002A854BB5|nr:D-aminoacyl-tRNA deacylase [Fusobacterium gastrosuis]